MTTAVKSFRQKSTAATVVAALRSDEHAPISAMIEIADRCNEVCVHCYQIQGQKGEMTTEELKSVIDQLADLGVVFLTITGGEPTLRHDFLEIVAHARKRKFAVKIFTNGLRVDREMAKKLAELAVQEVQISLYSHRAEVHDWVTRVPGSFDKTVAAARSLIDEGIAVVLKSPMMTFNAPEYDAWIDFVVGLGADYTMDPHIDPREDGDRGTESFRVDDETYLRARRDARLGGEPEPASEPPATPPEKHLDKSLCGACSGNVHVEANGEIRPCTQMRVPLGNALVEGVRATWDAAEESRFIRHLTWADIHGCRDCDLQPYCSRCYASAQVEGGDALGPYLAACHEARLQFQLRHGRVPEVRETGVASRDPRLGPYRQVGPGVFHPIEDVVTEADRAVGARFPWVRPAEGASPAPSGSASPGGLVQIRRPGRRAAVEERVPNVEPALTSGLGVGTR